MKDWEELEVTRRQRVYAQARKSRDFGRRLHLGDREVLILPKGPGLPVTDALERDFDGLPKLAVIDGKDPLSNLLRKHKWPPYRWYRGFCGLFNRKPKRATFGQLQEPWLRR
jgi:hypothetical protein